MPQTKPSWTAVIPVRAGSKGLPHKNTRLLAGKPLYRHAIDQALAAGAHRVVVTTDIPEILNAQLPAMVTVIERPQELGGDTVPMAPVLAHALSAAGCSGTVVLLQATSPLREVTHIAAALDVFRPGYFELVLSVTAAERSVLKWGVLRGNRFQPVSDPAYCFANRQSLPPVVRPNGAVYVVDADWFVARGSFVSDRMGVIEMSADQSQDIDTLADFEHCERVLMARPGASGAPDPQAKG